MSSYAPPAPDAAGLLSWARHVEGQVWGLESVAERFAERTCAKVATSGPDAECRRVVGELHGRVLAVVHTLADAGKLLEKKADDGAGGS